jgi:phenylpropionate dioxygenase-like ring-hydroxylating dioxygenase large terminal subunit
MGEELVLWRGPEGKIIVMRDRCPHRSAKLSLGKIVNGNIQCRYHGFQYDREGDSESLSCPAIAELMRKRPMPCPRRGEKEG